jgi:type IV fimbrial biogenesis protein FimT
LNKHSLGFTLLEVLLAIVLIAILVGIGMPTYFTLIAKNDLDVAKNQVAQSLGRAKVLAISSDGDITWGVKILSGNIIVFKGVNYSSRDINYDEVYGISLSVVASGLTEIVFSKMTGFPQSTGTITLTSNNGEIRNIAVNLKGTISY